MTVVPTPQETPMLLDPGMELTLRPMRYPHFYDRFRDAIKNTWTVEEVDLHSDLAAARAPYVDQSQSLNLFLASPTIGKLSSMYRYAWSSGLKSTYYLRSRPATRIQQATVAVTSAPAADEEAVACSLENPESCEACQ